MYKYTSQHYTNGLDNTFFSSRTNSYYTPGTHRMSNAMLRARRPYFWGNLLTFGALLTIPTGVYYYTFHILHKDDFEDIPVPPLDNEQVKQLQKEYREEKAKKVLENTPKQ